jgi:hypothetical protein
MAPGKGATAMCCVIIRKHCYEKFMVHRLMAGRVPALRLVILKGAKVSYFFNQYKFDLRVFMVFMYTLLQLVV